MVNDSYEYNIPLVYQKFNNMYDICISGNSASLRESCNSKGSTEVLWTNDSCYQEDPYAGHQDECDVIEVRNHILEIILNALLIWQYIWTCVFSKFKLDDVTKDSQPTKIAAVSGLPVGFSKVK